jgi:pimeloyl-ACP methyl ester carboxylesterase
MTKTSFGSAADPAAALEAAERRLLAAHGVPYDRDTLQLRDPECRVAVRVVGDGEPLVLIHGSGMCAATWTPLLPFLPNRRVIALDLPGFGLSDPHPYAGRSLRAHAVAQLSSTLDALELAKATIVGTSLGAMFGLCLALEAPDRVERLICLGVPAVALAGMKGDAYFRAMTTPGIRRLVARAPVPGSAKKVRRATRSALGRHAAGLLGDEFFEVVRAAMLMPGWSEAMSSHLNLAMRFGRPRPENVLGDAELAGMQVSVDFIWGEDDRYGAPEIGKRATRVMPDARLHVMPGGHAPFLDDPAACARIIDAATRRVTI